jgi:prephenate dehydrogenase
VVIVGLGLLGSSLALAMKRRRLAKRVVALGRDLGRLRPALKAGVVDEASVLASCAAGADLIVLCGPFTQFERQLRALAVAAPEGCLVTDVGSVKGPSVARWHKAAGPLRFVASHPMAGGERTGWRHGSADLFEGAACLMTPLAVTRRDAVAQVGRLWQALGADVSLCSPAEHDRLVARVSHVPHAAAFALALAESAGRRAGDFAYAGKGWRDTTRVAASDAQLWSDVFLHHPQALAQGLKGLEAASARLRRLLAAGKPAGLKAALERAAAFRRDAGEQRR